MVHIGAGQYGSWWFGVAWTGEAYVATALGSSCESALRIVQRCVPDGVDTELWGDPSRDADDPNADEPGDFLSRAVRMLGELERGIEDHKHFSLAADVLPAGLRRILTAAAAIPIGYVSTYGNVAAAAGSQPRAVGQVMAGNPLYPIVACHRVVGADLSLVGYGGRQDARALAAKLARLQAETRGYAGEARIEIPGGPAADARPGEAAAATDASRDGPAGGDAAGDLPPAPAVITVYPVEWVIEATREREERATREARRRMEELEAERRQLELF